MGLRDFIKHKLPATFNAAEYETARTFEKLDSIKSDATKERLQLLQLCEAQEARLRELENAVSRIGAQLESQKTALMTAYAASDAANAAANAQSIAVIEKKIEESRQKTESTMNRRGDRLESLWKKTTPSPLLSFEVALAEHCNLKCAGCDHFSPIAQPEFADLEAFRRDFQRLSQLFDRRAQEIHLLGGEPLLHPQIADLIRVARECFPQAVIDITTNGVLLGKMGEDFWTACRENQIVIRPTKYPIALDYDALEKLAVEKGVEYRYIDDTGEVLKKLNKFPLDPKGQQDGKHNFSLCYRANKCVYLQHGRLYTCTVAPTAHHLSKKFGLSIVECPEDSIDIYAAQSAREILEFLAKPIPFCKYCMQDKTQWGLSWTQSHGELSEWTL